MAGGRVSPADVWKHVLSAVEGRKLATNENCRAGPRVVADGDLQMTPLDKLIKRELRLDGQPYTVTITPEGVQIVPKGKRRGHAMTWRDLLSGDAELSLRLQQSVKAVQDPGARPPSSTTAPTRADLPPSATPGRPPRTTKPPGRGTRRQRSSRTS